MARIRSIKPEFWTSAQVLECSTNARLLFIGLWNFCDDKGRHPYSAKQAKAEVFPADDFTEALIDGMLQELSTNGLITRYSADGKEYFFVNGWKHQRIDKAQPAKYPEPVVEHSKNDPIVIPPDRKGEDRIGKEAKGVDARAMALRQAIVKAFEDANSPNIPDTSRAELWLSQGYEPPIIVATIRVGITKKPSISSLNYFDNAIREAHENRRPAPIAPIEIDWPTHAARYGKDQHWPPHLGPEPGMGGCRCPAELLEQHGTDAATGMPKFLKRTA